MSEGLADQVIIDIQRVLDSLPCTPSNPCIFRVDSHLRNDGMDSVYDPEILSIGPYHHGISRLLNMEQIKYRYLKRLLKRRDEQSLDRYVTAVAPMEKRARKCYADPLINVDEISFVSLMVLDGLFLIELFRYCAFKNSRDTDDPIFRHERILSQVRHDVLLVENQLPFFVLNQLFNMTKTSENPDDELITLALRFVDGLFLNLSVSQVVLKERLCLKNSIDHLCGLLHHVWCLPFAEKISQSKTKYAIDTWANVNSISGLREAGIKFENAIESNNLMDIKFENGALRIPLLTVFDETESQLRNLVAYEQYLPNGEPRYVSDYTFFMHCLINTPNDVEILRSRGIVENCLGEDQEVCAMFNRLGRNILTSSNFGYSRVFIDVNEHCGRRVKRWTANLRRNYFNSPWSIFSFIGAVVLLLLAATQTTYTVLTYYERRK